jgi:murein DD-endopeptidase MepM/ murein hydrolase activator NlpD
MKTGDPVYAAFDGVVRISKFSPSYGYMVVIRHYNGFETLYGHFSQLLCTPGQLVKSGMPIGLAGSTGHYTGSHLHFEIRFKGKNIDPTKVISFDNRCLISDTICLDGSYFQHLKLSKVQTGPGGKNPKRYGSVYVIRKGDTS